MPDFMEKYKLFSNKIIEFCGNGTLYQGEIIQTK